MDRYLELNPDGVVVNIIVWDGISPYNPEGYTLMLCADYPSITFGWTFDGDNWVAPPEH
jgi:hypothetical protein